MSAQRGSGAQGGSEDRDRLWRAPLDDPTVDGDPSVDGDLGTVGQDVSLVLAALTSSPAQPEELRGRDAALAAFRAAVPSSPRPPRIWRIALPTSVGARLGAALATGALALGGTTAAAYAGALPDSAQSVAHAAIGAPAPAKVKGRGLAKGHAKGHARDLDTPGQQRKADIQSGAQGKPSGAPDHAVGPDARGPAAYGLCNAWKNHAAKGKDKSNSVAFRNLARAAGGVNKIAAYCAALPPRPTGDDTTDKPSQAPKAKPTKAPKDKPTGNSTKGPSSKSTDRPTGKATPSAKPSQRPSPSRTSSPATSTAPTTAPTTDSASGSDL